MLLTKLSLQGFKSFANKTEIRFDPGVTAIIGPNGSGKSNISESVRWVLGEQSAKSLRGTKMEDIIFAGTQSKRPQAYCEVELTLDNTDGLLPVDFSEVQITRRVYRSGESEYLINRAPCRLRDIVDLFRDTGIGREGYSIIGQGRIEEILSPRSEDRREVFEEAVGISKFRARKEEAERKLSATRDNLVRIGDTVDELYARLAPLYEQSETAKHYLKLKDELKGIELNAFLHQYERAKNKMNGFTELIADSIRQVELLQNKASALSASAEEEELRARSMDTLLSDLQRELLELTRQVEKQDGESRLIAERMENIAAQATQARAVQAQERENAVSLQTELASAAQQRAVLDVQLAQKSEALHQHRQELDERLAQISRSESELEDRKEKMLAAMNSLSSAKVRRSRLETMLENIDRQETSFSAALDAAAKELDAIAKDKAQVEKEGTELKARFDLLVAERKALEAEKAHADQALRDASEAHRNAEREQAALHSRLTLLQEMQQGYEGYYTGVRSLLKDCKAGKVHPGILGVVAQLFHVPAQLEKPVEYALGTAMQNIVTTDETAAKAAIEHLHRHNYGRATFLPLTAIKPRLLTAEERAMVRGKGVVGVASELVTTDAKYRSILENLLGRTVITEDMATAIALAKSSRHAFRIITLQGDIIHPGGSMTGGSAQKKESGLLGRSREIEQLRTKLKELAEREARYTQTSASLTADVQKAADALEAALQRSHEADVVYAHFSEQRDTVLQLEQQYREQYDERKAALDELKETRADIASQMEEIDRLQSDLEQDQTMTTAELAAATDALAAMRTEREALTEQANRLQLEYITLEKEREAAVSLYTRTEQAVRSAEAAAAAAKAREQQALADLSKLKQQTGQSSKAVAALRTEANARMEAITTNEQKRDELLQHVKELEAQAAGFQREVTAINDTRHQAELGKSKAETELTAMQNRIWDEYELTYEGALAYKQDVSYTASTRQTDQIRKEIRSLGDVNVNAIEDYKNVKERYDALYTQQQDLLKAEADLSVLIEELMGSMRKQFKSQFTRINKFFSETFVELFGGGTAELRLNGDDVLTCDIDIIAQPPGKKLQMLSLLSGGEKALTAIALMFAILKHKPMPFCLLDEIESSLDEANVDNFANYLKRYADNTQFILITHRKGSMEVCDTLYGVAMEEKGVSKLVSVKLADALEAASKGE